MVFQLNSKNYLYIFIGTEIAASSRIPFLAAVLPINLVLYLKDLKLSVSDVIALLKFAASSLE